MATRTLLTADDLLRLPKGAKRYELVKGELVEMAPPGAEHGIVAGLLAELLGSFVRQKGLGHVAVEAGFVLAQSPDTVRAPDVAFISKERLVRPLPKGYYPGSPDVAIEVLSPNDTFQDVQDRIEGWLSAGARSVWLVDPGRRRVTVYAHPFRPEVFEAADTLSDPAVPGFSVRVADLFPEEA